MLETSVILQDQRKRVVWGSRECPASARARSEANASVMQLCCNLRAPWSAGWSLCDYNVDTHIAFIP